jgi:hypothetical protein
VGAVRLLVTGSRWWTDTKRLRASLDEIRVEVGAGPITVVHGASRGADRIAGAWAQETPGVDEEAWPVTPENWRRQGRSAGHQRNAWMVRLGADLCVAFCMPCTALRCTDPKPHPTHGTRGCIQLAKAASIPVIERWPA